VDPSTSILDTLYWQISKETNHTKLFLSGHVSIRHYQNGSWFIQKLCEVFVEHGRTNHLEDLLKMTSLELAPLNDNRLGNFDAGKTLMPISLSFF